jgi:hypothetical protein
LSVPVSIFCSDSSSGWAHQRGRQSRRRKKAGRRWKKKKRDLSQSYHDTSFETLLPVRPLSVATDTWGGAQRHSADSLTCCLAGPGGTLDGLTSTARRHSPPSHSRLAPPVTMSPLPSPAGCTATLSIVSPVISKRYRHQPPSHFCCITTTAAAAPAPLDSCLNASTAYRDSTVRPSPPITAAIAAVAVARPSPSSFHDCPRSIHG